MDLLEFFGDWKDVVEYPARKVIFSERDTADVMYVILSGEIEPDKGVASAGPGERIVVLQQDQFAYDEETAFNEGLMAFPEVILFASHDHQFVSTVANRIVELTPKGSIDRPMSFDDYLASAVVAKEREAHYCGERALAL